MANDGIDSYGRKSFKKRKSSFKIIPIFYHITLKEFDELTNHIRWQSRWDELALVNPNRIVVEKWKVALKYLHPINGLVYDGLDESKFQKEIVDAIYEVVPPAIKLDDSYIQGKSCMCKVNESYFKV